MIDLHLHSTASDGLSSPSQLVDDVLAAGVTTFSVTDHDTVDALGEAARLARRVGLALIPGVEITAVHEGRDVHILGYFIDPADRNFLRFLSDARTDRLRRADLILDRLRALGAPIDRACLFAATDTGRRAIARPIIARALVAAGHVQDVAEAFDRFLGEGRPAYVPRTGASPADVVATIHRAGGIASFAHPGTTRRDELIADLAAAGLEALEAFHSDHSNEQTRHYLQLADRLALAVSGGSDYHGRGVKRSDLLGRVHLPLDHFAALERAAFTRAHATAGARARA
jgi:predicted metal-dependent phosphoesterase TrpH